MARTTCRVVVVDLPATDGPLIDPVLAQSDALVAVGRCETAGVRGLQAAIDGWTASGHDPDTAGAVVTGVRPQAPSPPRGPGRPQRPPLESHPRRRRRAGRRRRGRNPPPRPARPPGRPGDGHLANRVILPAAVLHESWGGGHPRRPGRWRLTAEGRPDPVGGVPPGLVQRVQRRLTADGRVAADPGGLRTAVTETLGEDGILLPEASLAPVVRAVGDELTGLGPLAPLLADPAVTDVLVNGPTDIWVERGGGIERAAVRFASAAAVAAMVQRVVAPLGLRVDEARPWVDARLPGGERFHAVLPPLAPDGPVVTIRTFARRRPSSAT